MANRVTRLKANPTQQSEQQSRAKWTTSLSRVLVGLMVEQVYKGNKKNNSFGTAAWKYICDDFSTKTGLKWDKEQLKYRFAGLRKQFFTVKSIIDHRDFLWDDFSSSIIANNEIWDKYIKEHPDAESIKTCGCPFYKQLCIIFSEPISNGKHDMSAECEGGGTTTILNPEPLITIPNDDSSSESEDVSDEQDKFHPTTSSGSNRKRGRKGIDDFIAGAIMKMAASSKLRTAAILGRNTRYTISNCIKELDRMRGVDERVYFVALDLFNNPNARETFLALKHDKRLHWLRAKCDASSQ